MLRVFSLARISHYLGIRTKPNESPGALQDLSALLLVVRVTCTRFSYAYLFTGTRLGFYSPAISFRVYFGWIALRFFPREYVTCLALYFIQFNKKKKYRDDFIKRALVSRVEVTIWKKSSWPRVRIRSKLQLATAYRSLSNKIAWTNQRLQKMFWVMQLQFLQLFFT